MKKLSLLIVGVLFIVSCKSKKDIKITSPNEELKVEFGLNKNESLYYIVKRKNEVVIDTSYLGFEFKICIIFRKDLSSIIKYK